MKKKISDDAYLDNLQLQAVKFMVINETFIH